MFLMTLTFIQFIRQIHMYPQAESLDCCLHLSQVTLIWVTNFFIFENLIYPLTPTKDSRRELNAVDLVNVYTKNKLTLGKYKLISIIMCSMLSYPLKLMNRWIILAWIPYESSDHEKCIENF